MPQPMSREMFRLWAPLQRRRYERLEGVPIEMSPERYAHADCKSRVWLALRRAIDAARVACVALPDGMTVEVGEGSDYEPDAAVHCGGPIPLDAVVIPNPIVVVEVLSPSTQRLDTGDKLVGYFRVPSIHHYLIVGLRQRRVIHHRRAGQAIATSEINSGPIRLDPPGIVFEFGEIYPV